MLKNDIDQDIINEVAKIEAYPGWNNNSKIYKLLKWLSTICLFLVGILIFIISLEGAYVVHRTKFFSIILVFFDYIPPLLYIMAFFSCMLIIVFTIILVNHFKDIIGKGTKNIEGNHNHELIVYYSLKNQSQLEKMKFLLNVNFNKTNNEIIYFIQMAAVGAFIFSNGPKLNSFSNFWQYNESNGIDYFFLLLLFVVIVSNVALFSVYKMVQRKSSYALSIIDAAVSYKKLRHESIFKVKNLKGK
ncbi:hypothetical protein [Sodalis ligni]|uniref:Uncharacterized protein n=1 Tax=Sodalis ligni TaxID=2697027 RepID=A0A4R1NDK1_9GAMM|nr:hypothetical protein [Sodalis ligni]TCL03721.1 hypothetical protein EZJ58_1800 [Sodalis ligni]